MINIVYAYAGEPQAPPGGELRHKSVQAMKDYIENLVFQMRMGGVSVKFLAQEKAEGPNDVTINGRQVKDILATTEIKPLEYEDTDNQPVSKVIKFDRAPTDWDRQVIEDISDTLMKNAIAKVFAEEDANRIL